MIRHHQLRTFQRYHKTWLDHNFPEQKGYQPLLGLIEEVGELAHAHLKMEQGIRAVSRAEMADAVGDIMIYLASYCNANDLDMAVCLEQAWEEVSQRDWRKFPTDGRTS